MPLVAGTASGSHPADDPTKGGSQSVVSYRFKKLGPEVEDFLWLRTLTVLP